MLFRSLRSFDEPDYEMFESILGNRGSIDNVIMDKIICYSRCELSMVYAILLRYGYKFTNMYTLYCVLCSADYNGYPHGTYIIDHPQIKQYMGKKIIITKKEIALVHDVDESNSLNHFTKHVFSKSPPLPNGLKWPKFILDTK